MAKEILISNHNKEFVALMKKACKAIKEEDAELLEETKKVFTKAEIDLFYNEELDMIRVLQKDRPPVDFAVSKFYN